MSERGVTCDRRAREDMISFLPDHLLCQILSDVPTKTAVMTSVLSTRWRTIWLAIPLLDLYTYDFPNFTAFASFISRFLAFSKGSSSLHKLKLAFGFGRSIQDLSSELWKFAFESAFLDPSNLITQWMNNEVTRKVQHLDIMFFFPSIVEMMPLSIYTCVTLVSLKLSNVSLADSEYVSLPCLKIMHLVDNVYTNDAFLEKLISSCPVLEDLKVVRNGDTKYNLRVLQVRSESLKSLVIKLGGNNYMYSEDTGRSVVIDAPRLNYLSLEDHQSTSFVISKLGLSAKVNVHVSFNMAFDTDVSHVTESSKRSLVRTFFTMLSTVRDMTLSGTTLQIISHYLKDEPLPQFPYLIRFHAISFNSDLGQLPNILESCPNLKSLVLELEEFKMNELLIVSSLVPECLRSSLEYVELITPIRGAGAEIELVKYLLENLAVLKKLKLCLRRGRMNEETIILMELLRLRRCSPSCEVVMELEELAETCQSMMRYYNFL